MYNLQQSSMFSVGYINRLKKQICKVLKIVF